MARSAEPLVIAEQINRILQIGRREFEGHAGILPLRTAKIKQMKLGKEDHYFDFPLFITVRGRIFRFA